MSLALAALGRLGRALMPGAPGAPTEFEPHRRIGSEGPSERRPFKLTKFHIIFMISAVASLILLIVGYALYEWYGVMYVAAGLTVFILLPLLIWRIVVSSRRYQNRSLRKRKNFHKSAEHLHKAHPHLYATNEEETDNNEFLKPPPHDSLYRMFIAPNESHEDSSISGGGSSFSGSPPQTTNLHDAV